MSGRASGHSWSPRRVMSFAASLSCPIYRPHCHIVINAETVSVSVISLWLFRARLSERFRVRYVRTLFRFDAFRDATEARHLGVSEYIRRINRSCGYRACQDSLFSSSYIWLTLMRMRMRWTLDDPERVWPRVDFFYCWDALEDGKWRQNSRSSRKLIPVSFWRVGIQLCLATFEMLGKESHRSDEHWWLNPM